MNADTTRIRFKIGRLEVECEGSESFLKDDLSDLLDKLNSCFKEIGETPDPDPPSDLGESTGPTYSSRQIDVSTATIASRLDAKSAADLAIAASAYLVLVNGKASFSRAELLDTMKTATAYYKPTMSSNLSSTLNSLVRARRLNETASRVYALTPSERETMENLLAEHQ